METGRHPGMSKGSREAVTQSEMEMRGHVEALLRLIDPVAGEQRTRFVGQRKPGGIGRVFGGQVIAQAVLAASRTVAADRLIHSLHAYFMRPGSEDHEIAYQVDADMDGRAFSNRRVVAQQSGKAIFNMIASFHRQEAGPHHQADMPAVPPPETLRTMAEYLDDHPGQVGPALQRMLSRPGAVQIRPVETDPHHKAGEARAPYGLFWMRVGDRPLDAPQAVQRAVLALISDMLLLGTAYRPHGLQLGGGAVQGASIDHSLWFHGDVECGDWLLYETRSPWSGGARGLANGRFFARDGRLVASVAQEGLIRPL